jgi:hypothetical protein
MDDGRESKNGLSHLVASITIVPVLHIGAVRVIFFSFFVFFSFLFSRGYLL